MKKVAQLRFVSLLSILLALELAFTALASEESSPEPSSTKTIIVYGGGGASYMQQFEHETGVVLKELTDDDILQQRYAVAEGDVLVLLGGGGRGSGQLFFAGRGSDRGGGFRRELGTGVVDANASSVAVGRRGGRGTSDSKAANQAEQFLHKLLEYQTELKVVVTAQVLEAIQQRKSPLATSDRLIADAKLTQYAGRGRTSRENLRRLLGYLAVTYAGVPGEVQPPKEVVITGFYHPALGDFEPDLQAFLAATAELGIDVEQTPRVVILANHTHFVSRNQLAIDAMLNELTNRGAIGACMIVEHPDNRPLFKEFAPQVAIDAFHRGDDVAFRTELGIPHLYAMWLGRQTVEEWENSVSHVGSFLGIESGEVNGSIEPTVVSGRSETDSVDRFVPITDRINRIVSRALAWARLARKSNEEKRIAMLLSNAPGGDLQNLKSLEVILRRMREEGYLISGDLSSETLQGLIEQYAQQFTPLEADQLDQLARSGKAALIPADDYRHWLEAKVPEAQRKELVEQWGKAPGKIMTWSNDQGEQFLVIPKLDLGNVSLVAKPFPWSDDYVENFEQNKRDRGKPPSHNVLATYFWLEESYEADALMVWGTLSFDFLVPGKSVGQSSSDWSDILLGSMPNVRPFSLGSLTFALPAKRKAKAVLVDYLPPPQVAGEIDDQMLNLQGDLVKFYRVQEGSLKERFRQSISDKVYRLHLDQDLHWETSDKPLVDDKMMQLADYLNQLDAERVTLDRHVLGEPPRRELEIPYIVTCLGKSFLDELANVVSIPAEAQQLLGDGRKYVRQQAEEIVRLIVDDGFSGDEAIQAVGGNVEAMTPKLKDDLLLATELHTAFGLCSREVDRVLAMFSGCFVPPGPSSPPERNPGSVPTGRNMYVMNPEEIPTRQSWEVGKNLVDDLLARQLEENGNYPHKIAYSIHTRGTMSDFGVAESQILYTLGVRPIWSRGGRVVDVELIPAEQLGRPRIDVFIEPKHYYTEYLESRVRLIDKAIRLVAELDEPDNFVRENTTRAKNELLSDGIQAERAELLARARIFATSPERFGSGLHDKLFKATGVWDTEQQLSDVYISQHSFAYTEGLWAEESPEAFRRQIDGTDIVMRNMTRRGALQGRAHYSGGMLSLVTKVVSGKEPDYYLSDVRNPGEERVLSAHDAVRRDLRATLLNNNWITAQMQQKRGGAAKMAGMVWHTLGFRINNSETISDDVWEQITNVYLRDQRNLGIRDWLETRHPAAFQEMTAVMLEAVRKGYWQPEAELVAEIAAAHAGSVSRDGLEGDENQKLEQFVRESLQSLPDVAPAELLAGYESQLARPAESNNSESSTASPTEQVIGQKMVEVAPSSPPPRVSTVNMALIWGLFAALLFVVAGYVRSHRSI